MKDKNLSDSRHKMPRSVRAKQFLPFAALKGFPEALSEMEKENTGRVLLSEESEELIDKKLHMLRKGMTVELTYYDCDICTKICGAAEQICRESRIICINGKNIFFDDIKDVEIRC